MYFANMLYFILVILIALVVLLYFFRKQYKAVTNPSNLLWQQAMNEWRASPWIQKLQHNLLFWLQIAALTGLMIALAKPIWLTKGLKGEQVIWIVDTSATMSAVIDEKPLLDQSKRTMKQIISRLNGQEVTVIKAGVKPEILLNRETNLNEIQKTIDDLAVTYEHENMDKAVKLAESLVSNRETIIQIFSDSLKKENLAVSSKVKYEIHNTRGVQENAAILSFGVAGKEDQISGLAVLENQGKKKKTFPFAVKSEDSTLFQQEVTIAPGKQEIVTIPNLPQAHFYQAEIRAEDQYAADNQSTAVYTVLNPTVYALGEVNPFFIRGLETLGIKTVQLDTNSAAGVKENGIILAEGVPLADLPIMPTIYINKGQTPERLIELKEPIEEMASPLTEYVDVSKTYIKYASLPMKGNWETVASSGNQPLIQTGSTNGQPVILLNFSLENTDWPLQPGFPIFLYNSYQWLANQTGFLGYFQPGEEKWLQHEKQQTALEIYNAAGKSISTLQLDKENFKAPVKPGIYQAVSDGQMHYFSVLLDDREKKPESASSFMLNDSKADDKEMAQKPNESLWFLLAIVVLLLLGLEWEVYRRGLRA